MLGYVFKESQLQTLRKNRFDLPALDIWNQIYILKWKCETLFRCFWLFLWKLFEMGSLMLIMWTSFHPYIFYVVLDPELWSDTGRLIFNNFEFIFHIVDRRKCTARRTMIEVQIPEKSLDIPDIM